MTNRTQTIRLRLWLRLVRVIGVIVPRRLRSDWRQEWEAELQYRETLLAEWEQLNWRTKLDLLWHSLGAFVDALWLQPRRWEDEMFQDLRFGIRMLGKNPGFTFIAVLTLTLGIGANSAIFSVVNAVLLRSLPYREPDRLVLLSHHREEDDSDGTAGMDFLVWRDQAQVFENVAAFNSGRIALKRDGQPEQISVGSGSANLFATLGVPPALGRAFTSEEDKPGSSPVVILGDTFWRQRFGGDPQAIGQTLTLAGQIHTIIGVMPPGFRFPREAELWTPITLNVAQEMGGQEGSGVSVIARLKPGATLEAAQADLSVILKRQQQAFPSNYANIQPRVIGFGESLVGNVRLILLILFGAVVIVLLIACANVANLLLARSAARQKEMAIRAALGAGRLRLLRQLLTESLLLSALGGLAGLFAAKWGVKLLVAMGPGGIARFEESSPSFLLDGRVLGFTCLVEMLVGLIAGIFPALAASKTDVNETLKAKSTVWRGGAGRALPVLMVAELALALVLLVGAGLMIKSFLHLQAAPKGFNAEHVLTLNLDPDPDKYKPGSPQYRAYYQEVLERVQALPGVQSAGLANFLPLGQPHMILRTNKFIEGRPQEKEQSIAFNHISPDYFRTMGIQIRAGRPFTEQDGYKAPAVVIVNETLARRFLPNENPIGRRLAGGATIVGVVGDTRQSGVDREVYPEVYVPYIQHAYSKVDLSLKLAVRVVASQNNPASLATLTATIRNLVHAAEQSEPISQAVKLDERLSNSLAERRFQVLLLSVFASLALIMAMVGIYGVISYAVSRRTHEIGIRMALGARSADVLWLIVRQGLALTLIGVLLGSATALVLTRVMKNLLFEVSTADPATFTLIALLLVSVAFIASYIPARRATKVDPLMALRHE